MSGAAAAVGASAGVIAALRALFSKSEDVIGKACAERSKELLEKGMMLFERLVEKEPTIEEAIAKVNQLMMILVQKTTLEKETTIEILGHEITVKKQKCR